MLQGSDCGRSWLGCHAAPDWETFLPRIRFPHCESHFLGWKLEVGFPASLAVGNSHVTQAHQSEASHEPLLWKREGGVGREASLCKVGWGDEVHFLGPAVVVFG